MTIGQTRRHIVLAAIAPFPLMSPRRPALDREPHRAIAAYSRRSVVPMLAGECSADLVLVREGVDRAFLVSLMISTRHGRSAATFLRGEYVLARLTTAARAPFDGRRMPTLSRRPQTLRQCGRHSIPAGAGQARSARSRPAGAPRDAGPRMAVASIAIASGCLHDLWSLANYFDTSSQQEATYTVNAVEANTFVDWTVA